MKTIKRFSIVVAAMTMAIFVGCAFQQEEKITAKLPVIFSITPDVTTFLNIQKELIVTAEAEDKGTLEYQWYVAESKLSKGTAVEDATECKYIPPVTQVGTSYYYCVITNKLGSSKRSVISPLITYTVKESINAQSPIIIEQPTAQSLEMGKNFILNVAAYSPDNGVLTYQWFFSAQGSSEDVIIKNATESSYEGSVTKESIGYYWCIVTSTIQDNGDGGVKTAQTESNKVQVKNNIVNAITPLILKQPENLTLNFDDKFALNIIAYSVDNGTLSYQWYRNENPIEGAVSQIYTGTVSAETVGNYYCEVTNTINDNGDGGNKNAKVRSEIKTLSYSIINAAKPEILLQPENVITAFGNDFEFTVIAKASDNGTLSYKWFRIDEDGDSQEIFATGNRITGIMSDNVVGSYYCVITNTIYDNGDGGKKTEYVTTNTVLLAKNMINALTPVITNQPVDAIMYVPAIKVLFAGASVFDDGTLSYQWYSVEEGEDEGVEIEGATEARYKIYAGEDFKKGYYCVVTNTIIDNGDGGVKTASARSYTAWVDAVSMPDVVSAPDFTVQPTAMNIAPYNQSINLSCKAESGEGIVFYRWYQSSDGTTATGEPVSGATSSTFKTPVYTEKGIYYYYCVATNVFNDVKSAAVISDVVSVAYTGLPVIYVNTPNKVEITSKEDWISGASISIRGASENSWNFDNISTSIRGRGNTTWTLRKKPYALKLDKKQEVMGMPKHKRWVLIANYLDNSFMRNEMAFYLSEQFGLDYTVRGEFCDLILNGEYKGLYWLGEAIKVDENRVNINDGSKKMKDDEDKDYLIEMDTYYDEIVKFKSSIRKLPYMIKNDDYMIDEDAGIVSTGGQARLDRLQVKITALEQLLYPDYVTGMDTNNCSAPNASYSTVIDVDSWAKFWLINEIMSNGEIIHPKSCYFTYDTSKDVMKAGPVWDFDYAALRISNSEIIYLNNSIYYNSLFKSSSFTNSVKKIWNDKNTKINIGNKIEQMRELLNIAATYDAELWGVNHSPNNLIVKDNFDGHVDFLKSVLENKFDIVGTEVNSY